MNTHLLNKLLQMIFSPLIVFVLITIPITGMAEAVNGANVAARVTGRVDTFYATHQDEDLTDALIAAAGVFPGKLQPVVKKRIRDFKARVYEQVGKNASDIEALVPEIKAHKDVTAMVLADAKIVNERLAQLEERLDALIQAYDVAIKIVQAVVMHNSARFGSCQWADPLTGMAKPGCKVEGRPDQFTAVEVTPLQQAQAELAEANKRIAALELERIAKEDEAKVKAKATKKWNGEDMHRGRPPKKALDGLI